MFKMKKGAWRNTLFALSFFMFGSSAHAVSETFLGDIVAAVPYGEATQIYTPSWNAGSSHTPEAETFLARYYSVPMPAQSDDKGTLKNLYAKSVLPDDTAALPYNDYLTEVYTNTFQTPIDARFEDNLYQTDSN